MKLLSGVPTSEKISCSNAVKFLLSWHMEAKWGGNVIV